MNKETVGQAAKEYATQMMGLGEYDEKWDYNDKYMFGVIEKSFRAGQSTQQPQESVAIDLKELESVLHNVHQVMAGYSQDDTWSDYDRESQAKLVEMQYKVQYAIEASKTPQPIQDSDGWQTEKPVFTEDCILLTASKYKDEWEYNSFQIVYLDGEDESGSPAWYWGWCNMDGEEYGDIADLKADMYKVIPLIK